MKAILSCAVVIVMTAVLYGGQLMSVHTNNGNVYFNTSDIDSMTFLEDSLTDARDGQRYAIVAIGNQVWMAENLNIGTRINGSANQTDNSTIEKYAYDDNEVYADTFGGLYQWDEAMNYSTAEGAQGICPDGWHIPTDTEWKTLEMYLGMSSTDANNTGWRGTDQGTQLKEGGSSGFQALLSGYRLTNGAFNYMGSYAYFWSSSQYDAASAWYRFVLSSYATVSRSNYDKALGFCARCVKD